MVQAYNSYLWWLRLANLSFSIVPYLLTRSGTNCSSSLRLYVSPMGKAYSVTKMITKAVRGSSITGLAYPTILVPLRCLCKKCQKTKNGAEGGIRTPDLLGVNELLLTTELPQHLKEQRLLWDHNPKNQDKNGGSEEI